MDSWTDGLVFFPFVLRNVVGMGPGWLISMTRWYSLERLATRAKVSTLEFAVPNVGSRMSPLGFKRSDRMWRVRTLGPSRAKLTLRDISKGAPTTRVLFGAGSIYPVVLWRVLVFFQLSFRRGGNRVASRQWQIVLQGVQFWDCYFLCELLGWGALVARHGPFPQNNHQKWAMN